MRFMVAAALTCVAGLLAPSQAAGQALKAEDAIAQTLSVYATAWNNADGKAIAELYTLDADDAVIGAVARGRAQIEKRYTQLLTETFRGTQMTMAMSSLRFVNPSTAIVDGSFELSGASLPGGVGNQVKRLFIAIIVNDNDQWRVTALWSAATSPADPTH